MQRTKCRVPSAEARRAHEWCSGSSSGGSALPQFALPTFPVLTYACPCSPGHQAYSRKRSILLGNGGALNRSSAHANRPSSGQQAANARHCLCLSQAPRQRGLRVSRRPVRCRIARSTRSSHRAAQHLWSTSSSEATLRGPTRHRETRAARTRPPATLGWRRRRLAPTSAVLVPTPRPSCRGGATPSTRALPINPGVGGSLKDPATSTTWGHRERQLGRRRDHGRAVAASMVESDTVRRNGDHATDVQMLVVLCSQCKYSNGVQGKLIEGAHRKGWSSQEWLFNRFLFGGHGPNRWRDALLGASNRARAAAATPRRLHEPASPSTPLRPNRCRSAPLPLATATRPL